MSIVVLLGDRLDDKRISGFSSVKLGYVLVAGEQGTRSMILTQLMATFTR